MKEIFLLALVLSLSGCDKDKSTAVSLTCNDSPIGRSKEDQRTIADACFRRGKFKKSASKNW